MGFFIPSALQGKARALHSPQKIESPKGTTSVYIFKIAELIWDSLDPITFGKLI